MLDLSDDGGTKPGRDSVTDVTVTESAGRRLPASRRERDAIFVSRPSRPSDTPSGRFRPAESGKSEEIARDKRYGDSSCVADLSPTLITVCGQLRDGNPPLRLIADSAIKVNARARITEKGKKEKEEQADRGMRQDTHANTNGQSARRN